jgi:hypothetical protein
MRPRSNPTSVLANQHDDCFRLTILKGIGGAIEPAHKQ